MGRLCIILSVFQAIYLLHVSSQYFYEIKKDTEWDLAENGLMLGEEIFLCNLDDACKRVVTRQNKKVYEKQYDGQLGMQGQLNSTVLPGNKTGNLDIGINLWQSCVEFLLLLFNAKALAKRSNISIQN